MTLINEIVPRKHDVLMFAAKRKRTSMERVSREGQLTQISKISVTVCWAGSLNKKYIKFRETISKKE